MAKYLFSKEERRKDAKPTGDMIRKSVYVREKKRRGKAWFLPLILTAFVLFAVLWLLPRLFDTPEKQEETALQEEKPADAADPVFTVGQELISAVGECPLFDSDGYDKVRTSTALYGDKMTVLETKPEAAMVKVRLEDGFTAYADRNNLSADIDAVSEKGIRNKALVLSQQKRVMSHTMNGSAIMEVPMGTLLYADYQTAEVLRLRLTDGREGWVSTDGLNLLPPDGTITTPPHAAKLFVGSAMNFYGSRFVPGGMSRSGADMAGIIYISAKVNGLTLPRTLEGQAKAGEKAELIRDVDTKLVRPDQLETGDVLFFHDGMDKNKVVYAAIILEQGQALMQIGNDSIIVIRDLEKQKDLMSRLYDVRRYFSEQ